MVKFPLSKSGPLGARPTLSVPPGASNPPPDSPTAPKSLKPASAWLSSQKGLFFDFPQRQSAALNVRRPCPRPHRRPRGRRARRGARCTSPRPRSPHRRPLPHRRLFACTSTRRSGIDRPPRRPRPGRRDRAGTRAADRQRISSLSARPHSPTCLHRRPSQ